MDVDASFLNFFSVFVPRNPSPWGLLGLLLPGLELLELVFVGPEIPVELCSKGRVVGKLHTKSHGSTTGVAHTTIVNSCHRAFYHDFVESEANTVKADLRVLLNAGIHHYPSWRPSLECIFGGGKNQTSKAVQPALFTSWAMPEAVMTFHLLQQMVPKGSSVSIPCANRWTSLLPRIAPDDNCGCQFNNRFMIWFSGIQQQQTTPGSKFPTQPDTKRVRICDSKRTKSGNDTQAGFSSKVIVSDPCKAHCEPQKPLSGPGAAPFTFGFDLDDAEEAT